MPNPASFVPGAAEAIQSLAAAVHSSGVDRKTLDLVHLRASQINGCSSCTYGGFLSARQSGETDERLVMVAAWREAPFFDDAERAALALAEAVTRMADRPDPVPDAIWEEAARHYDEKRLGAIVLWIAMSNLFNRLNATVRQPAGAGWG